MGLDKMYPGHFSDHHLTNTNALAIDNLSTHLARFFIQSFSPMPSTYLKISI